MGSAWSHAEGRGEGGDWKAEACLEKSKDGRVDLVNERCHPRRGNVAAKLNEGEGRQAEEKSE